MSSSHIGGAATVAESIGDEDVVIVKPEPVELSGFLDAEPQCHATLWHEDGNMMILAKSTIFRVHENIVASQSPVLKALAIASLFKNPTQEVPDAGPSQDGNCLWCFLHDDAADVEQLLFSLYDTLCTAAEQVSFNIVSVWLRLGTKYKIARLRDEAIRRLTACYPTTLTAFDLANSPSFVAPIEPPTLPEASMVVFLALTYNIPQVLPTALYYCSLEEPSAFESIIDAACKAYGRGIARNDSILVAKCYQGRSALLDLHHRFLFSVFGRPLSPDCKSAEPCETALNELLLYAASRGWLSSPDVFFDHWGAIAKLATCASCEAMVVRRYKVARMVMWTRLPCCFGLDPADANWPSVEGIGQVSLPVTAAPSNIGAR